MLRTQENITNVIIAKNIDRSVGATAGTLATPALLADGEVVITDTSLQILNATNVVDYDKIFVVQGRGSTKALKKYLIEGRNIDKYLGSRYTAAVEQVSYIGYTGTSGAIDVINENNYIIRLNRKPNHFVRGNTNWYKYIKAISSATATQESITAKLASDFYSSFFEDRKLEDFIKMERLCSDAGAAVTGAPTSVTVTKGSKVVSYAGTDPSNVSVGDYLRIGGTTTAAPVYKVTAINTTSNLITLDVPYEGTSATILIASVEVISAAAAATSDFGLKFTGKPYKFDVMRWGAYEKVRFALGLENFGATTTSTPTVASEGSGVYEQVTLDEWMGWANDGQTFIEQTPPLIREKDSVLGETYSPLSIVQFATDKRMLSTSNLRSEILIYTSVTAGSPHTIPGQASDATTGFVTVLDAYAVAFDFTAQINNLD